MWWVVIGTALISVSVGFVWGVTFTLSDFEEERCPHTCPCTSDDECPHDCPCEEGS